MLKILAASSKLKATPKHAREWLLARSLDTAHRELAHQMDLMAPGSTATAKDKAEIKDRIVALERAIELLNALEVE